MSEPKNKDELERIGKELQKTFGEKADPSTPQQPADEEAEED